MQKVRNSKDIIEEIESLLVELKQSVGIKQQKSAILAKRTGKQGLEHSQFSGLTGEIYTLVKDGFFKDPKDISEIQKKLRDEGVVKPTTSLMPSLILLVRKKVLGRNKPQKGTYKYFKR